MRSKTKEVVVKQERQCLGCDEIFPKGTQMTYTSGLDDEMGCFFSHHMCMPCKDFFDKYRKHILDDENRIPLGFIQDCCEGYGFETKEQLEAYFETVNQKIQATA